MVAASSASVTSAGPVLAAGLTGSTEPRPNFVVIVTDDQRWDTIGRCLGTFDAYDMAAGADACMPYLQSDLMAAGTTFRSGYVTTALCCPSRATILSGQYARHHGAVDNNGAAFVDSSTLATWLDDAGYRTGLFGKYLNGYGKAPFASDYVPPGWDSWHAFAADIGYSAFSLVEREQDEPAVRTSYSAGSSTSQEPCAAGNNYSTDLLCARALEFLAKSSTAPFFMYLAPYAPHLDPEAPGRWRNTNAGVVLPTYPNHNAVPSPDPSSWLPTAPLTQTQLSLIAAEFRRQLDAARGVDDAIHAIYQQLEADGRLANTVFVYLSDNGLARAEHRADRKACEFEECHKVPFVVVCPPGVCPGSAAHEDFSHFALNIDIAPTIAELAGVTPGLLVDGVSLVPLLNDPTTPWRSSFLIEDESPHQSTGIYSTEPDGHTYKYVELFGGAEAQMFDITADPWELTNLIGDGQHDAVQTSLSAALTEATTNPKITFSGPSGATNQVNPTFTWSIDRQATYQCGLDSAPLTSCGSGTGDSISYTGLTDGAHTLVVSALDRHNNRTTLGHSFVVDSIPPTLTMKSPAADTLLTSGAVKVAWAGSDSVKIERYDLYERVGTAGPEVLIRSSPAVSYARTGTAGTTYCYRVVAFDTASNSKPGPERCVAVPSDDRSADVTYTGSVSQVSDPAAYGGTLTLLEASGSRATQVINGRRFGIMARKGPSSGRVKVFVDGILKATIDLYAPSTRNATHVYTAVVPSGVHTVEVVAAGTKSNASSGITVAFDGLAAIS